MGRGRLSLKLISAHRSRTATFRKRTKSLMKKAYELSTLCDVRTCVLIHGPAPPQDGDLSGVEFHTWPLNREEIEGMIRAYKTNYLQKRSMKSFDLYDYFSDRMKKIETERSRIREDAEEIKYPRWDERLDCLAENQLRVFMDDLGSKIEIAEGMIGFMEGNYDHLIGEGASGIDCIGGSNENQTLNSENSTIDSQWFPYHDGLQTEEVLSMMPDPDFPFHDMLQIEESLSMMPDPGSPFHDGLQTEEALSLMPDHDFSNSLFCTNGVEHTYEDLFSETMIENDNMGEFHSAAPLQPILPLSYLTCASDCSQIMNNAFSQVHDRALDCSDFEYLMTDTFNFTSDWSRF